MSVVQMDSGEGILILVFVLAAGHSVKRWLLKRGILRGYEDD